MRENKGIAITFNWIFSIIIGAIILSFFVYFAVQHTDLFGTLTAKQVAWEFDSVFSGFQTTLVETTLDFDKPIELEFKCYDGRETILINNKGKDILRDKIIFSPNGSIEDSRFLLWTSEWKVPYKVSTFIFLTTPRTKYFFEGDKPDIDWPDFLEYDSNAERRIEFNKDNVNRCIWNGDNPYEKIINYQYDEVNENYYGWICTSKNDYRFYGTSMIYAAVFADDFDCLHDVMMGKLRVVSKLYNKKAEFLRYNEFNNILTNRGTINEIGSNFKSDVDKIRRYNKLRFEKNDFLLY